ncbi:hypothetical protein [Rhizobium leguminosarum]|uniref:hypothetical protein n=1 Tax=Rhizobium leguminosarum TaxID=384 RepID=UPI001C967CC0|nr:hypothetical protein [Rhizobium leguminosarum]MBY5660454.1 hypothetical protein [Rhizobium leguminosarum]MBY5674077.1 hypothetical protein [Rhizobium leguminosarum]
MLLTIHLAVPAASTHDCTAANPIAQKLRKVRRLRWLDGIASEKLAGGRERLEASLEMDGGEKVRCHDCVLNSELLENSEDGRRRRVGAAA